MNKFDKLEEGCFYHIYNRGNNKENIFYDDSDYAKFTELIKKYLLEYAEFHSMVLMPNHFHMLIRICLNEPSKVSRQYSNFFNAYTKWFNRKYDRTGSLFTKRFSRKYIDDESYLINVICYIHTNPEKHKFVSDFTQWKYNSYHIFHRSGKSIITRKLVLDLLGEECNSQIAHREYANLIPLKYKVE